MASTSQQPSGLWTLLTAAITIVTLLFGSLLIQPRLTERRVKISDRYILTPVEVEALPSGVLAAVLDRGIGDDENAFHYRLLKLVLERSGSSYVLGLSAEMQPRMKRSRPSFMVVMIRVEIRFGSQWVFMVRGKN